jgi:hypothetical protein
VSWDGVKVGCIDAQPSGSAEGQEPRRTRSHRSRWPAIRSASCSLPVVTCRGTHDGDARTNRTSPLGPFQPGAMPGVISTLQETHPPRRKHPLTKPLMQQSQSHPPSPRWRCDYWIARRGAWRSRHTSPIVEARQCQWPARDGLFGTLDAQLQRHTRVPHRGAFASHRGLVNDRPVLASAVVNGRNEPSG